MKAQLNELDSNDVILSKVHADAPAATAGLMEGDRLLSIGGRKIKDVTDVRGAIFFTRADQFTTIEYERDGQTQEVSVKTLPRPEKKPEIKPSKEEPEASAGETEEAAEKSAAPAE